jgi:hypothetical protein
MNAILKKRGQYLGTKIEHKWWRRYNEAGFIMRGKGDYWIKDGSLFFQQDASRKPISLPLRSVSEIKVCPCRGRSAGIPVIKLVWEKDGHWLSSGFVLNGLVDKSNDLLKSLRTEGLRS